jgi:hypothetical protein
MEITDKKLLSVMEGIKNNLNSAYQTSYTDFKDQYISTVIGKINVLIEMLKEE